MQQKRGFAMTIMRKPLPSHRASRRYFRRMLAKWLKHAPEVPEPNTGRRV